MEHNNPNPYNIPNILALDTAQKCGYCIITNGTITEYGERNLHTQQPETELYNLIAEKVDKYDITHIAAEEIYLGKNVATFKKLAGYQGIIKQYAQQAALTLEFIEPTTWRRALLHKPYATKKDVITYTNRTLHPSPQITSDNTADAIGIALCYARQYINKERYKHI